MRSRTRVLGSGLRGSRPGIDIRNPGIWSRCAIAHQSYNVNHAAMFRNGYGVIRGHTWWLDDHVYGYVSGCYMLHVATCPPCLRRSHLHMAGRKHVSDRQVCF